MAQAAHDIATLRQALDAVALHGSITKAALALGIHRPTFQHRVHAAKTRLGDAVIRPDQHPARLHTTIENGVVIVFNDAHYYPGEASTAHKAMLEAIKEFRPRMIVANGDVFDGSSISRHPRIGWEPKPTVKEELECVSERMGEIEKLAGGYAKLIRSRGNHDDRFETFLSANASQFEGVGGFTLQDHFPAWMCCWRVDINPASDGFTIIKHRYKGGAHAPYNNAKEAGCHFVTGHLHRLQISRHTNARGTWYGVDPGCLAEVSGDHSTEYTEDGVTGWRSGFAVLTYRHGLLLPPELVEVITPGVVTFRGKLYNV
jgi:hypothetical protein